MSECFFSSWLKSIASEVDKIIFIRNFAKMSKSKPVFQLNQIIPCVWNTWRKKIVWTSFYSHLCVRWRRKIVRSKRKLFCQRPWVWRWSRYQAFRLFGMAAWQITLFSTLWAVGDVSMSSQVPLCEGTLVIFYMG